MRVGFLNFHSCVEDTTAARSVSREEVSYISNDWTTGLKEAQTQPSALYYLMNICPTQPRKSVSILEFNVSTQTRLATRVSLSTARRDIYATL